MKRALLLFTVTISFVFFSSKKKAGTPLDTSKIFCFQGHTTDSSVYLWCSMPQDLVEAGGWLYYHFEDWETTGEVYDVDVNWKFFEGTAYGRLFIQGLKPSTTYPLYFRSPKTKRKQVFEFKTYPSAQDSLTLLIGACAMKGMGWQKLIKNQKEYPIYLSMAKEKADAMLWTGDNLYFLGEARSDKKQIRKHLFTKNVPEMQQFLQSMPQYAIWDDHDYGPNNSDGSFAFKHLSFKNFNDFWANPAPVDSSQGIYYKISYPLTDIFMLDNRFQSKEGKNFLSEQQINWLKEGLTASKKPFKFIVSGIQAGNKQTTHETFYNSGEWTTLLNIIRQNKIEGVIFLNGDRHHTEIFKHQEEGLYPIYEYTCSPLTSFVQVIKPNNPEYDNPARIRGITSQYMYGIIRIVPQDGGTGYDCILEAVDEMGKQIWDLRINGSELRW